MKKITLFLMVFAVCAFAQSQNLALTGTATSSSNHQPASNAIDGNTGTRWETSFSEPHWIAVDLGASYQIGEVVLNWEGAYGKNYEIQISNDATFATYTVLSSIVNQSTAGVISIPVAGTGRYVRMYGSVRGTPYGFSLWEFEIYKAVDPVTVATLNNLTINGTTVTGFSAKTYTYNVELPIGTTVVPDVVATKTQSIATAVQTNASSLPGTTTVVVTSQNGLVTNTYTINFTVLIAPINQAFNLTFESGTTGSDATKWNVFENDSNPAFEVVANPNPSGVNTSAMVAKIKTIKSAAPPTIPTGGAPWAGCESQHGTIWEWVLNNTTTTISIDVYKTTISDVGVKMVNTTSGTVFQLLKPNTVVNAWETLTFDITSAVASGDNHNVDQIVIFPDWKDPRATDNITYFDNIKWNAQKTKEAPTVLGVSKFDSAEFLVYPNPSQNVWNINSSTKIVKSVQVFDVLGKQVISLKPNTKEVSIDASKLQTGLYFAKVSTETGSKNVKLIKN